MSARSSKFLPRPASVKGSLQPLAGYVSRLVGRARRAALLTLIGLTAFFGGCAAPAAPTYVDEVTRSVVILENQGAQGSGVVVGKHAVEPGVCKVSVLTAEHVASAGTKLMLGASTSTTEAFVVVSHSQADIAFAVFYVRKPCYALEYEPAEVAYPTLTPLDVVLHVGYPRGELMIGEATYVGKFTVLDKPVEGMTLAAGPGSSGGGIFYRGKLIGILVMGENYPPFRNYFTNVVYVHHLLPDFGRFVP